MIATFEGRDLRLAESWAEATACISDLESTRCYRTADELRQAEGLDRPTPSPRATCGSYLELRGDTGYNGLVLYLTARGTYIALSGYGFDNITSSYKIGACSARFYDGGSGSTQYPGSTSAGVWASSMVSGWDNRVSTVYIL